MAKEIRTVYMTVRVDIDKKAEGNFSQSEADEMASDIKIPTMNTGEYEVAFEVCGINEGF